MAIIPSTKYTGQIDTSDPTGYPYGKARNVVTAGDGTGTPLEKDWVNDLFGFQQALLARVGVLPTTTPDKVGASQYLDALKTLFENDGAAKVVANMRNVGANFSSSSAGTAFQYLPEFEKFYAIDFVSPNALVYWSNDCENWTLRKTLTTTGTTNTTRLATDGTVLRIGTGGNVINSGTGGDPASLAAHSTIPAAFDQWSHGTTERLASLAWTGSNWIVGGYPTARSEPAVYYAVGASTTWTASTMPSLANHLNSIATSVVVRDGASANVVVTPTGSGTSNDVFVSSNHGATFTASTPSPAQKYEHCVWSDGLGCIVAHNTSDVLCLSTDGVTWNETGLTMARINVTSDGYIIGLGLEADSLAGAGSGMFPVYVIRELSAEASSALTPFVVYAGDIPFFPNTEELLLGDGAHTYVDDDGNQYLARWW